MRAFIAIAAWLSFEAGARAEALNPAEAAFEKGRLLAESARYERACAAFELSQRLDPQFGTLFNLAGCYVHIGKVATASRLYRELSRSDINLQRRAEAARLVTELEPRVPTVRVRIPDFLQSPTVEVFVGDTEVTSLLDVDIPFDPGRYVITASRPGFLPFRREIYLHSKEVASVDVELERELAPISRPVVPPKRSRRVLVGKITLATGGGFMAFGAFAAWRWYINEQEGTPTATPTATPEEVQKSRDRALRWGGTSAISFFIGAVGVAMGSVIKYQSRDSRALRVAPAVGSGSASLLVNGAF